MSEYTDNELLEGINQRLARIEKMMADGPKDRVYLYLMLGLILGQLIHMGPAPDWWPW